MYTARFKQHSLSPLSLNAVTVAAVGLWLIAGGAPASSGGQNAPRSAVVGAAAMDAPIVPGAPRAWENGVEVSPYSTVNLANGNVFTVIPITSWSGRGPAVEFTMYHNSADGQWRPSYGRTLSRVGDNRMTLTLDDGRAVQFILDGAN